MSLDVDNTGFDMINGIYIFHVLVSGTVGDSATTLLDCPITSLAPAGLGKSTLEFCPPPKFEEERQITTVRIMVAIEYRKVEIIAGVPFLTQTLKQHANHITSCRKACQ